MAFTRKALEAMGIESAKIEQIMELHVEVVEALKAQAETYKADAEKLPGLTKEVEALKKQAAGDFESKYNAEHEAFEAYKKQISQEAALTEKKTLYTELLKGIGIDDARISAIVKVTDFAGISVKEHALEKADALKESAKTEWAAFISKPGTAGAGVDTPPAGNTGRDAFNAMSLSERMAYANAHPAEVAEYLK